MIQFTTAHEPTAARRQLCRHIAAAAAASEAKQAFVPDDCDDVQAAGTSVVSQLVYTEAAAAALCFKAISAFELFLHAHLYLNHNYNLGVPQYKTRLKTLQSHNAKQS